LLGVMQNYYSNPEIDDREVTDLFLSQYVFPTIQFAHDTGLLATLQRGPHSACELAGELSLTCKGTIAVCRVLEGCGILHSTEGSYTLSTMGEVYFRMGSDFSWLPVFELPQRGSRVLQMKRSIVIDGNTSSNLSCHWSAGREPLTDDFHKAMSSMSKYSAHRFANDGLYGSPETILEIGCGVGTYTGELLKYYRNATGTLVDLERVTELAQSHLTELGLIDRAHIIAGNMHEISWPVGFDMVLLANVLHDWDYCSRLKLLSKAKDSLKRDGTLFIVEPLFDTETQSPLSTAIWSLVMACSTDGEYLTFADLAGALNTVGFLEPSLLSVAGYHSLIMAKGK